MQQLIRDLIAYSQISAAERTSELVDLNELVADMRDNLRETIGEKGASLQIGALPVVPVVRIAFQQLFDNLVNNALKYHRPGVPPVLTIAYQRLPHADGPDQHVLTFTDRGIGFDPLYRDRIFKLFQRLHGQQQYGGTGIGLAICQRVMHNHGGTIEAIGQPGEGATFILRWPAGEVV